MLDAPRNGTKPAGDWLKGGVIFAPRNQHGWIASHAQCPTPYLVHRNRLRIYYGTRDATNRTLPTYIDVMPDSPSEILDVHDRAILDLGELGCFDDSGVMPSCAVEHAGRIYLYYIGWNTGTTVPYRNSIGVAVSDDGGTTFVRLHAGPVLDRCWFEPHFCATPFVMIEGGVWRMWYLSCIGWEVRNDRPEPRYHIRYAESQDGIDWRRTGTVCIDFANPDEAIARPWVLRRDGKYCMWYCYRALDDYRTNPACSYRIGYAESPNGINWERRDSEAGLEASDDGWDSQMMAYPAIYSESGSLYMLYNGNGFGQSGFGFAVLNGWPV